MEPITHLLTGACIGRAGFNRKSAYATAAAALAAEAADIDVLWYFAGPVAGLKHHRGFTHTLWAAPLVAAAVLAAVWLFHRWRKTRPHAQTVHWLWLYLAALTAALSHLLLDWSNNYGLRPLFPFNPRWYAGSFMFIAEPLLWILFALALVMPWIFGLADREIGARRSPFRGRGWAIFALCGAAALGCWRWAEHAHALALLDNVQLASAPVKRTAAEPYPINPFRWHAILETADYFQSAEIDTRTGAIETDPRQDRLYKPADTPAVEVAKRTSLGQVYLDWSSWPVVRDQGHAAVPGLAPPQLPPSRAWTAVEFTDLRFDYAFLATRGRASVLGGWVYIVDNRDEAGEILNGRVQR